MYSLWDLDSTIHAIIVSDISKLQTEYTQLIETETLKFKTN